MEIEKIIIGNIEVQYTKSGVKSLFDLYYNQECNPDRINKLKEDISKFKNVDEKIQYCRDLYNDYLLYLDSNIKAVSGMTIASGIFPPDAKLFFDEKIQLMIDSLEAEKLRKKQKKREITAPAVALFAQIVNFSEVIIIGENEGAESYCERVINHFKISDVKPNVSRKKFKRSEPDLKESDNNFKIIVTSILPTLTGPDKEKIQKYINSKMIKVYG